MTDAPNGGGEPGAPTATTAATLRIGHSPDPDDAFMWWPMFELEGRAPAIDTGRFAFRPVELDIESLNRMADSAELEITAMSCAQYPHVKDRYAITSCGASLGDAFGPRVVAGAPDLTVADLAGRGVVIAVPGERTSAFAALSLLLGPGAFRYEVRPFERIIEEVAEGRFPAGLVIHEGQLTFEQHGLHLVEDLGRWWTATEGLPLPLGLNTVRRDLDARHGPGTLAEVTAILRRSVEHALTHREESIRYALGFARGIPVPVADRFVDMYVNAWTLEFGERGRAAVRRFLRRLAEAGLAPDPGDVDVVTPA